MADRFTLVPFACAFHTVVACADAMSVRGEEPPNHPLVFEGGLEKFDFLLQHAFFGEG